MPEPRLSERRAVGHGVAEYSCCKDLWSVMRVDGGGVECHEGGSGVVERYEGVGGIVGRYEEVGRAVDRFEGVIGRRLRVGWGRHSLRRVVTKSGVQKVAVCSLNGLDSASASRDA